MSLTRSATTLWLFTRFMVSSSVRARGAAELAVTRTTNPGLHRWTPWPGESGLMLPGAEPNCRSAVDQQGGQHAHGAGAGARTGRGPVWVAARRCLEQRRSRRGGPARMAGGARTGAGREPRTVGASPGTLAMPSACLGGGRTATPTASVVRANADLLGPCPGSCFTSAAWSAASADALPPSSTYAQPLRRDHLASQPAWPVTASLVTHARPIGGGALGADPLPRTGNSSSASARRSLAGRRPR